MIVIVCYYKWTKNIRTFQDYEDKEWDYGGIDVGLGGKHMLKPWETLNTNGVENNIARKNVGIA